VLALVVLVAAVASGCSSDDDAGGGSEASAATSSEAASFERVSIDEAFAKVSGGDALLVDVREQQEWDAGHAPQATHIPLGELAGRLGEVRDAANGRPVVMICRSGNRSLEAAQIAASGGIDDVSSVDGGMGDWAAAGHPLVPEDGVIV
jgi:rhodanese-related sulfurtransferase